MIIKDKNPPDRKNGANGIYLSPSLVTQTQAKAHAMTMAIANPTVPNHMPPAPNNLMSPNPIGGYFVFALFFLCWSNRNPTTNPRQYPIAPPIIESALVTGHGKKVVTNNPANRNGNKYTSGIMRRLKS